MSSTQAFSMPMSYSTVNDYWTAGSGMSQKQSMLGVTMMFKTSSTSYAYSTINSDGMSLLYPNSTAHPIKMDFQIAFARSTGFTSGTGYCVLHVNGSDIASQSATGASVNTRCGGTNLTNSSILSSTKSSTIKLGLKISKSSLFCAAGDNDSSIPPFCICYFTRYDFSATAGSNVSSASVSSSTGYDGDTVTYSCVLASGATFDGWYNGSTRVSTSQTYTHTVNGADLTLTAKATASAEPTKSFSAIYGNSIIINQTQSSNVAVGYNSGTIATLSDSNRIKHLLCKDKLMSTSVTAGGKALNCGGKVSSYNIPMLYCHGSWELNKGLANGTATLTDASGWVTTPFIPVSGKINVTVETGGTRSGSLLNEYDSGFGYASYWGAGANPRTFTLDTAASYIRCTFLMSALANCSIYDNTNGKYLFKGGNVQ